LHLINEISLALQRIIININNKMNLLKLWTDAKWFYKWTKKDADNGHCICFALIPMVKEAIEMQEPENYF
jgi:hypothetical protein